MRFLWLLSLTLAMLLGCKPDEILSESPIDRPYYPSALLQDGNALYVLSSNFDQRYNHGTVLSVDLEVVDAKLAAATDSSTVVGTEAVTSSGYIPSLVDGATLSPAKDQIFFVSRAERTLRVVPLVSKKIACGTSALGQDCYSSAPSASLSQNNPYFLLLNSPGAGQAVSDGIITYPLSSTFYRADSTGAFPLPQRFEFQRFTWNAADSKVQSVSDIPFGDLFGARLEPTSQGLLSRTNVRIGGIGQKDAELFTLFDAPMLGGVARSVFLARISLLELQSAHPDPKKIAFYDVGGNSSIHSAGPIAIRSKDTNLNVFATNERPGVLLKLEFPADPTQTDASGNLKISVKSESVVCDLVNDLKLSPDDKKLVVACDDGKILIYDADSFELLGIDPAVGAVFGRAPANILFDERANFATTPFRFYTANFHDGSVGVYDLYDAPIAPNTSLLKAKGRIFSASPLNREGGI